MNPKVYVSPFSINWFFDNRNLIESDPECGNILLSIWDRTKKQRKTIGVGLHCTAEVFEACTGVKKLVKSEIRSDIKWRDRTEVLSVRAKERLKADNDILLRKLNGAMDKAQSLNNFEVCSTITHFKKLFNESVSYYVFEMFDKKIQELKSNGQWKTAELYGTVRKSVSNFRFEKIILGFNKKRFDEVDLQDISFAEIDIEFLKEYEKWLLNKGSTKNGIGIYMTHLRTIYRMGITKGVVRESFYPFGKSKYKITKVKNTKEVLDTYDWSLLMKYDTLSPARKKAFEIFKLSYALNGANTFDICTILKTDLKKDRIQFYRKKTERKDGNAQRVIHRTDFIDLMITKYGSEAGSPYLFDLLDHKKYKLFAEDTRLQCDAINNRYNKQLKKITKEIGIQSISMMWARHQRATNLIDAGATKEDINTMWGHDDMKTTDAYIHSMPNAQKIKNTTEKLDNELL
tara:strand:+ start:199 stop:1575 length:1377 start_codon:yes stop_codon:yes gene_type:complete